MLLSEKKPNFFIVGAPKCGTTTLSRWLAAHPDVFFLPAKETQFFRPDFTVGPWKTGYIRTFDEYLDLFAGSEQYPVVGEGSAMHLCSPRALKNIQQFNPQARIIAMVRNPVDMVHSFFWEMRLSGYKENARTPEEAWRLQEPRRRGEHLPPGKAKQGDTYKLQYAQVCSLGHQVEQLYSIFPREQVHVVFLDDIKHDPDGVYKEVLRFLELNDVPLAAAQAHNTRESRYHPALTWLHQRLYRTKKQLGISGGTGALAAVSKLHKRFWKRDHMEQLDPAFRRELLEYFESDIEKLEHATGRNLSHWKQ